MKVAVFNRDIGPVEIRDAWVLRTPQAKSPEGATIIDQDDHDSPLTEIRQHGLKHLKHFLVASGLAVLREPPVKFNRCDSLRNCIDIQFDSRRLSHGMRYKYRCVLAGREIRWSSEVG